MLCEPWWPERPPDVRVVLGLGGATTYVAVRIPVPDYHLLYVARWQRQEFGAGWHAREAASLRRAAYSRLVRWRRERAARGILPQ